MILSNETYTKLREPGFTLDNKLTAIFQNNKLYFHSFHNARRLFDLSQYFRDGTDADIEAFISTTGLQITDPDNFRRVADSAVRKKLAMLIDSGALNDLKPLKIRKAAKKYGLELNIRDESLVVPTLKKEIKDLLDFLDEDFYTSFQFARSKAPDLWWLEPHTKGPGAHSHDEDDLFYVIEGTMSVLVDGRWIDAPKGSFILAPTGVVHDFENRSGKRAGVLNFSVPGDFESDMPAIAKWFSENPPGKAGN